MKNEPVAGNQSGMALVLTLLTISFLVAVTVQLMITINRQVAVAAAQKEQVRLDAMVLGGLSLIQAALYADQQENSVDSLYDSWQQLDQDAIGELAGEVELKLTVTDLSGRLQVNALGDKARIKYREIWLRFLLSERFAVADEEKAEALVDALVDWVDDDDEEEPKGAEESFYRSLTPPYSCRNGKMMAVEELLLVKGMTPLILYGDRQHEGIINYITVAGDDGKLNLNTAPLPVLQAMAPEMNEELAQELIDYRNDPRRKELLATSTWYHQVTGIPQSMSLAADMLTVSSSYFDIRTEARLRQYRRTGTGLLHRAENHEQALLLWKIE